MPLGATAVAGLIGAGASLLGTGAQMGASAGKTRRARHWQVQQIDQQYKRFLKNRQYNEPINQMARLKEAGLNPHLVYGKGTVANTTQGAGIPSAPSAPTVQSTEKFNIDPHGEIAKYLGTKIQAQQVRKATAEADIMEATVFDQMAKKSFEAQLIEAQTDNERQKANARQTYKYYENEARKLIAQRRMEDDRQRWMKKGILEKDPFFLRYGISQYSGDAKALKRILDASAIAEGVGFALPKNILFGAGKIFRGRTKDMTPSQYFQSKGYQKWKKAK